MLDAFATQVPPPPPPAPGFRAPGPDDFDIPPMFDGAPALAWVDKPSIQLVFAAVLVVGFFVLATRRTQVVPGRLQFAAERLHVTVRDGIARDNIGPEFHAYVPFLVALFAFLLVNNVFGVVPLIQFPTMAHPGTAYALTAVVWVLYNVVGIRKHGFVGYLRVLAWPPGVPAWVRVVLTPLELLSNLVIRPLTLSLRLSANMFAGHLLLLVFVFGGEYMLTVADSVLLRVLSPFAFATAVVMTLFEAFIQVVQAFIFTILTASYIGTSLTESH